MAKKIAPKKKATSVKSKSVKSAKPPVKTKEKPKAPVKSAVKPAAKATPSKTQIEKKALVSKPALMTKKGKAPAAPTPEVEVKEVKKPKNIVSLIESETAPEAAKAEKVNKVKPVKVDRGNVADEKAKWTELNKKYGKDKAAIYKMTETFSALAPLQHKVLGWGFILTNENDRLEVLFETGIRMLISNYKH